MSMRNVGQPWVQVQHLGQKTALFAIIGCAFVLVAGTIAALTGLAPWLTLEASYGTRAIPAAGMMAQIFLTILAVAMCFYLPANRRILALESSHRDFHISMEDVAEAYAIAHRADREQVFSLSSEFDAVRERIAFMLAHPDLDSLEPSVLEVAAQMNQEARALSNVYSDEKVSRAKAFLKQRQEEIELYRERMSLAQKTVKDLKRWSQELNVEDSVVHSQMSRLEADLAEILPLLGYEMSTEMVDETPNVVSIATPANPDELRIG